MIWPQLQRRCPTDDNLLVYDSVIMEVAKICFDDDRENKLWCFTCGSSSCLHIGFCFAFNDTYDYIKNQQRKKELEKNE